MDDFVTIPAHLMLQGSVNYHPWSQAILAAAQALGIEQWLDSNTDIPTEEDDLDGLVEPMRLRAYIMGNGRLKLLILSSVARQPASLITGDITGLAMWDTLCSAYDGAKSDLWTNIEKYCKIDCQDFDGSATSYVKAFWHAKQSLSDMGMTDIKEWHSIMFVMGLQVTHPQWAQTQRDALNSRFGPPPTLEDLISSLLKFPEIQ